MKSVFKNMQQAYLNGKKVTLAEEWLETIDGVVFHGNATIKGHFKKSSTFERKNKEQNVDFY